MITGSELRDGRVRARLTQEQLAERVGVTLRSVGNWERSKVPANKEATVRDVLAGHLGQAGNSLENYSDMALLSEIGRRLAERDATKVNEDAEENQRRQQARERYLAHADDDPAIESIRHTFDHLTFEGTEGGGWNAEQESAWNELMDEIDFRVALDRRGLPYPAKTQEGGQLDDRQSEAQKKVLRSGVEPGKNPFESQDDDNVARPKFGPGGKRDRMVEQGQSVDEAAREEGSER